ncbi:MAG: phosphatidate cytidylyltransferase [Candidatus Nanopelagicales bacterium]
MADAVAEPEPAAAESKAGRNLPVAITAGVVLAGLCVASLAWQKWLFIPLAVIALWIGITEIANGLATRGIRITTWPLLVSVPIIGWAAYVHGPQAFLAVVAALVLIILVWRLWDGTDDYVRDATASVFVAGYLPLMLGFAILTLRADDGAWRIVAFIALTVGSDIGGYAAGVLFGKHPMAPEISPKKSWEGFAGSLIFQIAIGVGLFVTVLSGQWWEGALAGVILTITATLGDFIESALKRDLGIKDMGSIIPAHGGLMDRLDSLIPNAFVSWAIFTALLGS